MVKKTKTYKWAKDKTDRALKIDFIRFGITGTIGFTVTAIFLHIFHDIFGIGIFVATLMASECGLLSNFFFHQNWTYKHHDHSHKSVWKKFIHFQASSWSGVVIFTAIETVGVKVFGLNYLVALVISAGITMFWNFFWTKFFIFKGRTPSVLLQPEDMAKEN